MDLTLADLRGTLLVRDCLEADGAFLLVQIIKTALQGVAGTAQQLPQCPPPPPPPRVVLLAAAQVATHYVAVLRKAGLHAPALASAGRLEVIDVLPALGTTPTSLPSLRSVHQRLAAAVGGGSGGASGGVCLVADDLTALHCLAASAEDWGAFLHACTALGQSPGCCFVGLARSEVPDDEPWMARLEHAAALVLEVEPLESGRSADATGRVMVVRREPAVPGAAADAGAPGTRRLCYRLGETGASYVTV